MTARLLLYTLLRIHQQKRRIGVRRTRDHVPDKFLMAGCVDDEVVAISPMEPRLRHIDGDALELLFLEGVQEEGVLEWPASLLTDASGLFDTARLEGPGVRQQPPDERGLAVIDVPHHHEREPWHHMYPFTRSFSIACTCS